MPQHERRGLAHAVLQAGPHVDGTILVVNGDNVFGESLQPVVDMAGHKGVDGVLAVETGSLDAASKTGVTEIKDGNVTGIVEKPSNSPSTLVTIGCYVLLPTSSKHRNSSNHPLRSNVN
jgi:glucose-1-phosphate thymidylyltransferase